MKPPIAPKRWLEEKNAFAGQLWNWYIRIDRYASQGGKLEVTDQYIDQFLDTLNSKKDMGPWSCPYDQIIKKTRAYNYRKAFRYDDALKIFRELQKEDDDNYHLVEDCIETYLANESYDLAVEFLNQQPISLIASEASEAADHILKWAKKYPDFDFHLSATIKDWASRNQSK